MIDLKELIFVVDENNQPLAPQLRHIAHKKGLWHRTSSIWVINNDKHILAQKRSHKKDINPGKWEAFFGGHLGPNETYLDNAVGELGEELGIQVSLQNLIPYKILKSDKHQQKEFQHIFAYILPDDSTNFAFEKEEVEQIKWFGIEKAKELLVNKNDVNWTHAPWEQEVLGWITTLSSNPQP